MITVKYVRDRGHPWKWLEGFNLILYLFQEDCRQPEATSGSPQWLDGWLWLFSSVQYGGSMGLFEMKKWFYKRDDLTRGDTLSQCI